MTTNISVLPPLTGTLQQVNPMKSMIVLKRKWSAVMQAILTNQPYTRKEYTNEQC